MKKNAVIQHMNRKCEVRRFKFIHITGGVLVITKNMYLDMESDMALEELQNELEGIKLMFNEKNCFKNRKKEKKFKNKLCWD